MIKAQLDTSHFHFEAYGVKPKQAFDALLAGFERHAEQYGLDEGWWRDSIGDIYVTNIELNCAYRDNELLKPSEYP